MTNTPKIMKCGHCGKKTLFHLRAEGTLAGTTLNGLIRDHFDGGIITTWRVLECCSCLKPTLQEEKVEYNLEAEPGSSGFYVMEAIPGNASEVILYPGKTPLTDLPKVIEKRYLTALEVQDINPNAFAVLIGSVLEAVCNSEKIPGKNLREQIDNLVQSDRIPKPLHCPCENSGYSGKAQEDSLNQLKLRDSRKLKYPRGDGELTSWEKIKIIF
jgi:hypothetical protein